MTSIVIWLTLILNFFFFFKLVLTWTLERILFEHFFEARQMYIYFVFKIFRIYRMRHLNITNYSETLISYWFGGRIFLFFFLLTGFDQILYSQPSTFPTFVLELNCLMFRIDDAFLNRLLRRMRNICNRFILYRQFFDLRRRWGLFLLQKISNSTSFG